MLESILGVNAQIPALKVDSATRNSQLETRPALFSPQNKAPVLKLSKIPNAELIRQGAIPARYHLANLKLRTKTDAEHTTDFQELNVQQSPSFKSCQTEEKMQREHNRSKLHRNNDQNKVLGPIINSAENLHSNKGEIISSQERNPLSTFGIPKYSLVGKRIGFNVESLQDLPAMTYHSHSGQDQDQKRQQSDHPMSTTQHTNTDNDIATERIDFPSMQMIDENAKSSQVAESELADTAPAIVAPLTSPLANPVF